MDEQDHSHHGHHDHQVHQQGSPETPQKAAPTQVGGVFEINNRILFIILAVAILAVAVYARSGLLIRQGLFEPDGFFYYAIVKATISSVHLTVPQYLGISGFPNHNFIGEAPGLPYLTVIFYLLMGKGISYLTIMRWLPILFGILEIILAYFIAKELSDSRLCGLLAMFFVAVSAGDIARTAALVYRGDTFIAVPLMLALLIMIKGMRLQSAKRMVIYALVAAFILSTGVLVWNGSAYVVAIYMLSLVMLLLYAFISWKPELSRTVLIFTATLFLLYLLQSAYVALGGARPGILEGNSFLVFYLPVLVGAIGAFWLTKRGRIGMLHSPMGRALAAIIVIVIVGAAVGVTFKGYIGTLATVAGVSAPATGSSNSTNIEYAVGATTQELQKPSFSFLFASFELGLYLLVIGVVTSLLLLTGVAVERDGKKSFKFSAIAILLAALVFLCLLNYAAGFDHSLAFASFIVYMLILFLAYGLYSSGAGILEGKWHEFIILFAYLAVTAYLQYNAIRYNSLLAIPLAIFAAYGLYTVIEIAGRRKIVGPNHKYLIALVVIVVLAVVALIWVRNQITAGYALQNGWYLLQGYATIIVMLAMVAYVILPILKGTPTDLKKICLLAALVVVLYCTVFTVVESYSSAQADGINPSFLSAMVWLKNNTATNATVLALWPDGSVVEGWANRTSYMDSVGGENGMRIYYFARWLANSSADPQYLYGIGKPQYIVARQYWLTELSGLIAEGVPTNPQNYTFTQLSGIGQPQQNATSQFYFFSNGQYNVTLISTKTDNGPAANYSAYLGTVGQTQLYKVSRVTLYNTTSYFYKAFNATAGPNLNFTLMIFYTGSQIEGAIIMNNGLYDSNLFKLVWLCNQYQCPYSNSSARISPVFINNDTRIYKVTYT
jgi:asparagine N-glycosylation enzyme membrane subunit Stt3